ncbi:uncharacterized protein LY79DRAFT_674166 [Colletotrichum navitas]|uniref:Uncharacterized protein n=1 Tax=Colletotrichum navitas TaxID=681940 RepID=A0AAD8UZV6_9PEZI|nr:uncharacterized protein LY79DRAFT_674166 [Colletotrichum navitas]KAK1570214.1 hypothetical protein LY79DRAFT_674166 [Colletotrichum navitas]
MANADSVGFVQPSFSETFVSSPHPPDLMHFTVPQRQHFTYAAGTAGSPLQQQYLVSLNWLRSGDLLPDKFNGSDAVQDTHSVSTTTTDMDIHQGNGQLLHHQWKIVQQFDFRNASPSPTPFPSRAHICSTPSMPASRIAVAPPATTPMSSSPRFQHLGAELNRNLAAYQTHVKAIIQLEMQIHQIEAEMLQLAG